MTLDIVKVNAGGERFEFAKTTLQLPQNKDSTLERKVSGVYDTTQELFLDIDPAIFRKFCAPYIRHTIFPLHEDFQSHTEANHAAAACDSIGLTILADFIRNGNEKLVDVYINLPRVDGTNNRISVPMTTNHTFAALREKAQTMITEYNTELTKSNQWKIMHAMREQQAKPQELRVKIDSDKITEKELKPMPDDAQFMVNGLLVEDEDSLSHFISHKSNSISVNY